MLNKSMTFISFYLLVIAQDHHFDVVNIVLVSFSILFLLLISIGIWNSYHGKITFFSSCFDVFLGFLHSRDEAYDDKYNTISLNHNDIIKLIKRGDVLKLSPLNRLKALEYLEHYLSLSEETIDAQLILEDSLPSKIKGKRREVRLNKLIKEDFNEALEESEETELVPGVFFPISSLSTTLERYDSMREEIENDSCLTKAQKCNISKLLDKYKNMLLQKAQSKGKRNNPEERKIKESKYKDGMVEVFRDDNIEREDKRIYYQRIKALLPYDFDLSETQMYELSKLVNGYIAKID